MFQSNSLGAVSTLTNAANTFSRPKTAHVSKAVNGFCISTDKTDSYESGFYVAQNIDVVSKILAHYFAA
jgi:hypothetical protein